MSTWMQPATSTPGCQGAGLPRRWWYLRIWTPSSQQETELTLRRARGYDCRTRDRR